VGGGHNDASADAKIGKIIISDFICIRKKSLVAGASAPDPIVTAVYLLYFNITGVRQGPRKYFWGPGKVLEIFITKREGTL